MKLSQIGRVLNEGGRQVREGASDIDPLDRAGNRSDLIGLARKTVKDVAESDVPGLAAEMAYQSLFALFALLLLLAGLTAIADDVFGIENMRDRLVESGRDVLPQNASSVFEAFLADVVDSKGEGAVLFGLAGLVWSGSALIGTAMKALNRIFKVEERRGFVWRRVVAMSLALGLGGMLIGATMLVMFRGAFAEGLQDVIRSRTAAEFTVAVLSWPLAIVILAFAAAVLYWLGPDRDQPFRWVTPGAVLFAFGWVLASMVASFYIANAGPVNRTYGLIAAMIATIVWLYWSSLLFLAGAVLNARVEDVKEEEPSAYGGAEQRRPAQP